MLYFHWNEFKYVVVFSLDHIYYSLQMLSDYTLI